MNTTIATLRERPELGPHFRTLSEEAWPEFLHHADLNNWSVLFDDFQEFQFLLTDEKDNILGLGHTLPVFWDGSLSTLPESIDEITGLALEGLRKKVAPNTLCALAAIVSSAFRSQGVSTLIVQNMRDIATSHGFQTLIAPVRPTLKSKHPLVPIDRYIYWKTLDDLPFDPWVRVHTRMGAKFLKVAPRALVVQGTIQDWEQWTGMKFPLSGLYTVPGALLPVTIDCNNNHGRYDEPNVWMKHTLTNDKSPGIDQNTYW